MKDVRAGAAVSVTGGEFAGNIAAYGGGMSLLNMTEASVAGTAFVGNRASLGCNHSRRHDDRHRPTASSITTTAILLQL